ncbi:MAG TPA: hypothetical protein VN922_05905, partial [Bacteroidia bacterium]|nr:hypothetical protein [Bacteroidia bacterium]
DDIDFSALGRVDIYKGPTPLYGSYIAGAVNLFTPVPNQNSVQEQAIVGSDGLFRTNTTITASTGNSDIYIDYGHQKYNGFRPNDGSLKDFVTLAGNFHTGDKNTVSTYISYSHSVEQLGGEIDSAAFYKRNPDSVSNAFYVNNYSKVEIESFRAGVTDEYKFCKGFSNQTTFYTKSNTLNQPFAHGFTRDINFSYGFRSAFNYECKGDKLTVDGTLGTSLQKTNQLAEGDFYLPFLAEPPFYPTSPAIPSDADNYGLTYNIFTNWDFKLPSQLTITVGGSLNFAELGTQNLLDATGVYINNPWYVKVFTPVFTPNVSIIKVFNDNVSAYASMSMGYTPPVLGQIKNSLGNVDSTLKPESGTQYEIGTKGSLLDHKLSYQLALYDLDITNRLISEYVNSINYTLNAGEQRNMGAELYLAYSAISNKDGAITLLRPWISYTYSNDIYVDFKNYGKSKVNGGDTVLNDYSGNKAVGVAPNVFNLGIDLNTKSGFYLNVKFQYNDKVTITFDNAGHAAAYNLLGAKLGYKKQIGNHFNVDAFVGAENLTNSTYYTFLFYGPNLNGLAQSSDHGRGDGYILPAPFTSTYYGGVTLKYVF